MIIAGILIACYCILMIYFLIGFDRVSEFTFKNDSDKVSFCVIIPFRNESLHLPKLLASIKNLNYSKEHVEFIFVDDDSSDNSAEIITQYIKEHTLDSERSNMHLLKNVRASGSPKKDAIQTAIQHTKCEWIITTDADCVLPKNWLQCYNAYIQECDAIMIAGPVKYFEETSFLGVFQHAEFHTLQSVSIGGFGVGNAMMCNGANLAYTKTAFEKVHGFKDNASIASGDDVFLLEKMVQMDKEKVHFLKSKEALVATSAQRTWIQFIEQRVRWASKSTHYRNSFTKEVGFLVFMTNLALVVSTFLAFIGYFSWLFLVSLFLFKIVSDAVLYLKFNRFFLKDKSRSIRILSGICYPFISVFVVILSIFSGYTWKGRQFSK